MINTNPALPKITDNENRFIIALRKIIKEQAEQINQLEARIIALEAKV